MPFFYTGNQYKYSTNNNSSHKIFLAEFDAYRNLAYSSFIGDGYTAPENKVIVKYDKYSNIFIAGTHYNTSSLINQYPTYQAAGKYYQGVNQGEMDVVFSMFDKYHNLRWSTYYGGDKDLTSLGDEILTDMEPMQSDEKVILGMNTQSKFTPVDCSSPAYCDMLYASASVYPDAFLTILDYDGLKYPDAINKTELDQSFYTYPTLFGDHLTIKFAGELDQEPDRLEVITNLGQCIYSTVDKNKLRGTLEINTQTWSAGCYIVLVKSKNKSYHAQVIKIQ